MAEQTPVGAEQEKVEQQPKSPEKEGRTVGQIQKELKDTVQLYSELFNGIESSSEAIKIASENIKNPNTKGMADVEQTKRSLQEREDAARDQMYKLAVELDSHPDAPKDLPYFSDMSPVGMAKHFGNKI